jgi:hypothetical protein
VTLARHQEPDRVVFRGALGRYLKHLGAEDAAALLADATAT